MVNIVYNRYYKLAVAIDKILGRQSRRIRYKNKNPTVDYENSFFIHYPNSKYVRNTPSYYGLLREFYTRHKLGQRSRIGEFLNVPKDEGWPKIVRPYRTRGGSNYVVVESQEELDELSIDYPYWTQDLFPKMAEYRVIFVYGKPAICLRKLPKDEDVKLDPKGPWNTGEEIGFITVDIDSCNLIKTKFFEGAQNFLQKYPLDIAAFDVGWIKDEDKRISCTFEINCAPEISIENNLKRVVKLVAKGRRNAKNGD